MSDQSTDLLGIAAGALTALVVATAVLQDRAPTATLAVRAGIVAVIAYRIVA